MKRRIFYGILAMEALICVILTLGRGLRPELFTTLMAFPMEQIGYGLRVLSLSGGNAVAVILYVLLSLVPLVFLWKRKLHWEDVLLVLLSGGLFLTLYCMVNPGILFQWFRNPLGQTFEKAFLGVLVYSILAGYVVLRLVRSFFAADRVQLQTYLQVLLDGCSLLLVYQIFGSSLTGLLVSFETLREGNTGLGAFTLTHFFLCLQYLVSVLAYGLDLVIVHGLGELLRAERHSQEAVTAAERLTKRCGLALVWMVVSNLAYQLLQLVCLKGLLDVSSTLQLPLFSLLAVLAALLMAKLLGENKELKDDNDLFI